MSPICWQESRHIPRAAGALLDALRFRRPDSGALQRLDASQWGDALAFSDRAQLTLLVADRYRDLLPFAVRRDVDQRLARNQERTRRLRTAFRDIAGALNAENIEAVVLKGFAHWADYVAAPDLRVQYDVDLFCPDSALAAQQALRRLKYEPVEEMKDFPTDHLPTLVQKTGWQWRGDYFDPEMPYAVDLHFRLWDAQTERLEAPGLELFWQRRTTQWLDERPFLAFHRVDALAYAALHLVRHLLRGSVRPAHVYELAYFLDARQQDDDFWREWQTLHDSELRRLQAVAFHLAVSWFDCGMHSTPAGAVAEFPPAATRWFERSAAAPLEALFHPNKDELWLHLSLLESFADRRSVFVRRMLPARLPGPVDSVHTRKEDLTWRLRLRGRWRFAVFVWSRVLFHMRSLPGILWHGAAWWSSTADLGRPFWKFLGAAALFNSGFFLFVLLYNLLLLDRGFHEDLLGSLSTAMTVGSIAATLPAGALVERIGLRRSLLVCFGGGAAALAARVVVHTPAALVAGAFASGMALSLWAIAMGPAVAALTTERSRPLGFSLMIGTGMGVGVVAGLLGGRLPVWLRYLGAGGAKEVSILLGCALTLLAIWPVRKLHFPKSAERQRAVYAWSPFLRRFLAVMAIWNLGTGSFNPFFNAYFARYLHFPVSRIGALFSGAQLAQVAAVLLAPWILRRLGLISGIGAMQIAAGAALICLAFPAASAGVWAYVTYMSFQWMSEPGMNTVLMNRVPPESRAGAAALNYFVVFSAQALAAAAAGWAIFRWGYAPVLVSAGAVAAISGVLLMTLIRPKGTIS